MASESPRFLVGFSDLGESALAPWGVNVILGRGSQEYLVVALSWLRRHDFAFLHPKQVSFILQTDRPLLVP